MNRNRTKPYLRIYEGHVMPKSREEVENDVEVKVGHFVMVSNGHEEFWIEVLEVKPSSLKGRIDNDIEYSDDDSEYNDIIEFKWCHIMDHME